MNNGQTSNQQEVTHSIDYYIELVEKLEQENEQMKARLWVDSNLTKFDDVLRNNYDKSLAEFADAVIFHLAKLTQSIRGTFFNINTDTNNIEALAGYACTVETLAKTSFRVGEGLIGQAVKGRESITLDDIPANNMVLEASMGQLSGNSVVVIPLIFNQEVYGVIELLYLQKVAPKYIDLLERLSQNIASMLNSIQSNLQTRLLLVEAQELEHELRTQEEELRQNMEEPNATQEKMHTKERDLSNNINAINQTIGTVEFDMKGNILQANQLFLDLMGYHEDEIINKHHRMFVDPAELQSNDHKEFWDSLRLGKTHSGEFRRIGNQGKEVWLRASYTPVKGEDGTPYKIMKFALDITQEKQLRQDLNNQMAAINKSNAVVEFDLEGNILGANDLFLALTGYDLDEIQGKHHQMFMSISEAASREYEQFWHKLRQGQFIEGEFKRFNKAGEEMWINGNYNPIMGLDGTPYKIVKYANDITEQRLLQMQNAQQLEEIKAVEEEMRQNMEELVATQEEINRQANQIKRSKKLNDTVLETALDVIITMNNQGIVQSVNPAVSKLFGYEPKEVVGQNIKMLMPHKYASEHDGYLRNYSETRKRKIIGIGRQVEAQHKDGTVFDAYISVSEFKIEEEVIYTGFIRDISDLTKVQRELHAQLEEVKATKEELRQNMEEIAATQDELHRQSKELERNKKQSEAVLNTAIDVIITMNQQGIVETVNPALTKLFGYEARELIGENIKMLMPPQYSNHHDDYLRNYANTGQKHIIGIGRQVEAQHKDGTVFDAHISVSEFLIDGNTFYAGFIRKLD